MTSHDTLVVFTGCSMSVLMDDGWGMVRFEPLLPPPPSVGALPLYTTTPPACIPGAAVPATGIYYRWRVASIYVLSTYTATTLVRCRVASID